MVDETTGSRRPPLRPRQWKLATILLAISIALAVLAVQRGVAWRSATDAQHQRNLAVSAASAEVKLLISMDGKNTERTLQELVANATGTFRLNLINDAPRLRAAIATQKVIASGVIESAGVGLYGNNRATVFVAAKGTVSNALSTGPQSRQYQVKVTMQRARGRWLVAGLVFL